MRLSRRTLIGGAAAVGAGLAATPTRLRAAGEQRFDFTKPLDGWQIVTGKWAIEAMGDAAQGHALVQRATDNTFNVIVAPGGPYGDVEVSVRFKPISGREDASGGIVFRFAENHYYLIRANALEDNVNFYYYEGSRHRLAGASTKAPALGQWHRLRIRAEGDRIRGWLNEQQLIDRRDQRYKAGHIGLWTKADSITAFDELAVLP
jgi:3-keto-disaccharide hydrolase